MNSRKALPLFVFGLLLSLWVYSLFFIPTFDLDESLYRRVAQEMKVTHHWWNPTWDSLPLNHKPPFFYWMIAAISRIVDGPGEWVSIFSARFPSLLACLGILYALYRHTRSWVPSLLWSCAILPVVTATAVIYDPIQTLLLLPMLFIPTRRFIDERKATLSDYLLMAVSLFMATAWKGLNGIFIPTFAYGLHLCFLCLGKKINFKELLLEVLSFTLKAFIPAATMSFLLFLFLDEKMGRAFTKEFFLVHHLGRGTEAMEEHHGSILYHPITIFFGGSFLIPFLLLQWKRVKVSFLRFGFPLSYTLAFLIAFSLSATKLPHYTLPVWPALALWGFYLHQAPSREDGGQVSRGFSFFASLPILLLGTLLLFLCLTPMAFISSFSLPEPTRVAIHYLSGISVIQRLCFGMGTILCFMFQGQRSQITRTPVLTAFFSVATSLLFSLGVAPIAQEMLITPLHEIAIELKAQNPKPEQCIRYTGAHSPSLSLELGVGLPHNRCETDTAKFFIAPEWKLKECYDRGMKVVSQKSYLYLCIR